LLCFSTSETKRKDANELCEGHSALETILRDSAADPDCIVFGRINPDPDTGGLAVFKEINVFFNCTKGREKYVVGEISITPAIKNSGRPFRK
jgi:hypothetical protein